VNDTAPVSLSPALPPGAAGGRIAVMFSNMLVSKYMVWVAATLLLVGVFQILVGLFVFLSEALDIYMLVRSKTSSELKKSFDEGANILTCFTEPREVCTCLKHVQHCFCWKQGVLLLVVVPLLIETFMNRNF